jgi:hypothetical protein
MMDDLAEMVSWPLNYYEEVACVVTTRGFITLD